MGGVSKALTVNQEWVKKRFEKCDDILKRQVFLGEGRQEGYLVYVEVTVSNLMLEEHVIGLSDVQPLDGYEQAEAALLAVLEAAVEELELEQAVRAIAAEIPAATRKLRREIFFIFIHSSYLAKNKFMQGRATRP